MHNLKSKETCKRKYTKINKIKIKYKGTSSKYKKKKKKESIANQYNIT